MHSTFKFRESLVYGLLCAGALALPTGALAASSGDSEPDMQAQTSQAQSGSMAQEEPSKADELSNQINTFNENRGSLKEESSARSGGDGAHVQSESEAGSRMHKESPRANELSNEINTFNENGGTLEEDNDSSSVPSDSDRSGSTEQTRELSNEIDEYNDNSN